MSFPGYRWWDGSGIAFKIFFIADPLFFRIKKGVHFHLTSKHEDSFRELKEKLSSFGVLFQVQTLVLIRRLESSRGIEFFPHQLHTEERIPQLNILHATDPNDYPKDSVHIGQQSWNWWSWHMLFWNVRHTSEGPILLWNMTIKPYNFCIRRNSKVPVMSVG